MSGKMPGKLLAVTIGGQKIRCQTTGTLTMTAALTKNAICKADDVTQGANADWETSTIDSRGWTIAVDAQSFLDDLELNQFDLAQKFIANDLEVEVEFLTTPGQHEFPEDVIFAGTGILASLSIAAPAVGPSTNTTNITGQGALTLSRVPVVT